MSVFLHEQIDDATREALANELRGHAAVSAVEFVSKEQALQRFQQDFPELADIAVGAENPFPPSLEVRLRTDPASTGAADAMAQQLSERDGVVDVRYDRLWLSRLLGVITSVRLAGLAIAGVLILGAAFTVTAVTRLSLQARQEELDIMQLVGAPFAFIRGPAIAEGTLLGGIGAVLALIVLWIVFLSLRAPLAEAISAWGNLSGVRFLSVGDSLLLVVSGLVVGALAGLIASRTVR
jgi:cell division transport system permease protein